MADVKVYKAQHECNVAGTFTNEAGRDIPDKNIVDNLALQFPELPAWMLNAAVLFHNKNPNYHDTGVLGKKPLTGKEKRKQKREEFTVAPEWFGETPDEREKRGECLSQEEARLYMAMGNPEAVSSEEICKPLEADSETVEKIVSDI